MFGYEAPSYPHGICARSGKRLFKAAIVEVTALGAKSFWIGEAGGAERECLVRFADEHGMPIGLGKERNRPHWQFVLLPILVRRVDKTHRGLASVTMHSLEFFGHMDPNENFSSVGQVVFV